MVEHGKPSALDRTGRPLRVTWRKDVGSITVSVEGEIDLYTSALLDAALQDVEQLTTQGDRFVVDLAQVAFLGAAGLHVLVGSQQRCSQRNVAFLVVAAHRTVTRPIHLTGLAGQLCLVSRPPTGSG